MNLQNTRYMFSNHIYQMSEENRLNRLERARTFLQENRLDFMIICGKGVHGFGAWITGIMNPEFPEQGNGGFVIPAEGNVLEVDSNRIAEKLEPMGIQLDVMQPPEFRIAGVEHIPCFDMPRLKKLKGMNRRIGIVNASRLTAELRDALIRTFPDREFPDVTEAALMLLACKSEAETAAVITAAEAHDKVFALLPWLIKPGITEREIVLQLRHAFLNLGAAGQDLEHNTDLRLTSAPQDAPSIPEPILYPGRTMEMGDRINLTARCMSVDDYYAGLGRCCVLGRVTETTRRKWKVLVEAQEAAAKRLYPGGTIAEAAASTNRVLMEAGFAPCEESFISGTGYEQGEVPILKGACEDMPLKRGMTLVVAPILHAEGEDDFVCMDTFVITENGCERITRTSREILELEYT